MEKRFIFTGRQRVELESFEATPPAKDQISCRARYSLMSTGTENIIFNRNFEAGSHWDKWIEYPFTPGYCWVGQIEAMGSDVTDAQIGDFIVARTAHTSQRNLGPNAWAKIPDGIDLQQATWFAMAKIASMGARAAQYSLGEGVAIIGAGPIGQMSIRWARAAGCESITVIDPVEKRLAWAKQGGATATIAQSVNEAETALREANFGQLPRIVMDTTGNAQVFAQALELAAPRGKVVVLGDTGTVSQQRLSSAVMSKGLTIVAAHDTHEDNDWNAQRIYRLFFNFVQSGRFHLDGLITHTFSPLECAKAYEIANTQRGETMGILFDWSQL